MASLLGLIQAQHNVSLKPFTTLKAGGPAEMFYVARSVEELAQVSLEAQRTGVHTTLLGWGSNVLPSDDGVPGLCLVNNARSIEVLGDGEVLADTGCGFQELFLKTLQAGLRGLEFAVGIPGTLGGALVSNAGAYRSQVSEFLIALEIVCEGERQWVDPSWMGFSYRDSRLRQVEPIQCTLLRVKMKLPTGDPRPGYEEARDYQRQRISKQPPPASAGSFFKNVVDANLAEALDTLPPRLKEAGVVPAGYLIEKSGLIGCRLGGAMFASRHANFIVNVGNASATDIRRLATLARKTVYEKFGVEIEEEVLYIGDWSRYGQAS
ncbi:MAG TPA: UDP-N-acetylmuramate dehydrogenase [Fimbriimonadaceae bacterium]|nr:UDP-N-acetylmuramate dehydrogenase [Fimbriimonadaceae bacterium]